MKMLSIFDDIEIDKLTLTEHNQNLLKVKRFIEILTQESDYQFPPIVCGEGFFDNKMYVSDGHHRVLAYKAIGRKTIEAEIWVKDND